MEADKLLTNNPESRKAALYILLGSIVAFILFGAYCINTEETPAVPKSRKELITAQFSSYSGAHILLEKHLKARLNDPDSYEHVETLYWDMLEDSLITIKTTIRAKNGFGAKVLSSYRATADIQGNLLKVEAEQ